MTTVNYRCGLCGKPGEAKYQEDMVHQLERWTPLLHCNRCADYRATLRTLREQCKELTIFRWQLKNTSRLTKEREEGNRLGIISATKAISTLVCSHWRVATVWDPEFADQIIDFPDKAEFICNEYSRMIREQASRLFAGNSYE